jgi:hypothetical protein
MNFWPPHPGVTLMIRTCTVMCVFAVNHAHDQDLHMMCITVTHTAQFWWVTSTGLHKEVCNIVVVNHAHHPDLGSAGGAHSCGVTLQ